jgi:hypothetical protein
LFSRQTCRASGGEPGAELPSLKPEALARKVEAMDEAYSQERLCHKIGLRIPWAF